MTTAKKRQGSGQNSSRYDDTHHQVQIAHADADLVQASTESRESQGEEEYSGVGHEDKLTALSPRIDVRLVDVVSQDAGDGNEFGAEGASNSHELSWMYQYQGLLVLEQVIAHYEDSAYCITTLSKHCNCGIGENSRV